jgi:hypothetical protein
VNISLGQIGAGSGLIGVVAVVVSEDRWVRGEEEGDPRRAARWQGCRLDPRRWVGGAGGAEVESHKEDGRRRWGGSCEEPEA